MKSVTLFLISVILLCVATFADNTSIQKLLLSTQNDNAVQNQEQRRDFLTKGAYAGIPFIDDIELRLRDDAFNINLLRYTLRIRPRGIGETSAAKRYYESVAQNSRLAYQVQKNIALKERYMIIIDYLKQLEAQRLEVDLSELYADKIKVLEIKSQSTDFELGDLVKAENAYTDLRIQMLQTQKSIGINKEKIRLFLDDTSFSSFDTTDLVDIDSVIEKIEEESFVLDTNNVYLEQYRNMILKRENRYILEKAENRQYISYIGFSYNNGDMLDEMVRRDKEKDYNLNNAYSLELGIKLPDLTKARHDILRRKMDFVDEQEDYNELKRELDEKMKKDRKDLRTLSAQYRFLKSRENEVDVVSSLKKYLQMNGVDPLILLSIKESILENRINMSNMKFSILRNYIQVIDMSGELSKPPLKNFLSQNMEVMEP